MNTLSDDDESRRRLLERRRADDDPGPGVPRPDDPRRAGARHPGRLRRLPAEGDAWRRRTQAAADTFCDYVVKVMQRYPYVQKVIIGNEPNQPRFWQPIWNGSQPASPAAMEVVLASCYDKLKAFDPTLDVIGVGLSPRGNDDPVRVEQLVDLARALDQGARRRVSRERPHEAALRRVVVALLSEREHRRGRDRLRVAEHRLRQRRAREARAVGRVPRHRPAAAPGYPVDTTGSTLYGSTARMFIDETGWQVDTTRARAGLHGHRERAGDREAKQAEDYEKLVHLANCEPTLTDVPHLPRDRRVRPHRLPERRAPRRLQRARRGARDADSVKHAIQADNGACAGGVWQTLGSFLYSTSAVVPDYKTFPYQGAQPFAATTVSGGGRYVKLDAGEGFTYAISFKNGSQTANARGAAPRTTTTVKIPTRLRHRHGDDRPQGRDEPGAHEHGHAQPSAASDQGTSSKPRSRRR